MNVDAHTAIAALVQGAFMPVLFVSGVSLLVAGMASVVGGGLVPGTITNRPYLMLGEALVGTFAGIVVGLVGVAVLVGALSESASVVPSVFLVVIGLGGGMVVLVGPFAALVAVPLAKAVPVRQDRLPGLPVPSDSR